MFGAVGGWASPSSHLAERVAEFPAADRGGWLGRDTPPHTLTVVVGGGGLVNRPKRLCAIFAGTSHGIASTMNSFAVRRFSSALLDGSVLDFLHLLDFLLLSDVAASEARLLPAVASRSRSLSRSSSLSRSRSRDRRFRCRSRSLSRLRSRSRSRSASRRWPRWDRSRDRLEWRLDIGLGVRWAERLTIGG